MNWIILLLVFIAGAATSIQAGVNGTLGKKGGRSGGSFYIVSGRHYFSFYFIGLFEKG
ncbi:MAG: hypothetical protein NVV82_13685 [Sporocytophaga sp.]|nr:hypothetical protein [Sporocytophaga sp.]